MISQAITKILINDLGLTKADFASPETLKAALEKKREQLQALDGPIEFNFEIENNDPFDGCFDFEIEPPND